MAVARLDVEHGEDVVTAVFASSASFGRDLASPDRADDTIAVEDLLVDHDYVTERGFAKSRVLRRVDAVVHRSASR
jgi:hypothetical protein